MLQSNTSLLGGAKLLQFTGMLTPPRPWSREQQLQRKSAPSTTTEVNSYA